MNLGGFLLLTSCTQQMSTSLVSRMSSREAFLLANPLILLLRMLKLTNWDLGLHFFLLLDAEERCTKPLVLPQALKSFSVFLDKF